MAEFNENLWAPWRMEYIRGSAESLADQECFLCEYGRHPENDAANLVLWRSGSCLALLNRYPYSNGHLMVAPFVHAAGLSDVDDAVLCDMMRNTRDAQRILRESIAAQGFNIGMNFGKCAGAGLPGHLHVHVVPRWEGDTNFMRAIGEAGVIPQGLDELYGQLCEAAARLGLPAMRT